MRMLKQSKKWYFGEIFQKSKKKYLNLNKDENLRYYYDIDRFWTLLNK